jgi:GT2 family glycosyltransferase
MYLPGAVVFHIGSGSTNPRSDLSVYYGHRNLVWTFFKDMPGVFVWILSPLHILVNLLMIIISFSRKQGIVSLRAKFDAFNNFSMIIQKRKTVQSMRRISAIQLIKHMNWNPFSPFVRFLHK